MRVCVCVCIHLQFCSKQIYSTVQRYSYLVIINVTSCVAQLWCKFSFTTVSYCFKPATSHMLESFAIQYTGGDTVLQYRVCVYVIPMCVCVCVCINLTQSNAIIMQIHYANVHLLWFDDNTDKCRQYMPGFIYYDNDQRFLSSHNNY